MKIEYTYQEPKIGPIQTADFTAVVPCQIYVIPDDGVYFRILKQPGLDQRTTVFTKGNFAEFTGLINRLNKQIGNE